MSSRSWGSWLTPNRDWAAVVVIAMVAALPCLLMRYLPMVDLPQHEAIVSIMRHWRDPSFAFPQYYDWALGRTLYVFPYALALALSYVMPVKVAVHTVVFLAVLAYPLGILLMLRAHGKPAYAALLAVPLMYNQSFFWGFIHFNLAVGLALIALSELTGNWSTAKGWRVFVLSVVTATTHVHGLVVIATYCGAAFLAGDRRRLLSRLRWLTPMLAAIVLWMILFARGNADGGYYWPSQKRRWIHLAESVLGGWQGPFENALLGCLLLWLLWRGYSVLVAREGRGVMWTVAGKR